MEPRNLNDFHGLKKLVAKRRVFCLLGVGPRRPPPPASCKTIEISMCPMILLVGQVRPSLPNSARNNGTNMFSIVVRMGRRHLSTPTLPKKIQIIMFSMALVVVSMHFSCFGWWNGGMGRPRIIASRMESVHFS